MGSDTHETQGSGIKLSYEDYTLIPDDGKRHEIIDGAHFVNPAPNVNHQRVSKRLFAQLFRQVDETGIGECFAAPIDVQLGEHDVVQPDLIVMRTATLKILTPTKVKGSPDLVIEILSASNPEHDTVRKKKLYERAGVPEYWIVDPGEHVVHVYALAASGYELVATESHTITPRTWSQISIDLSRVW